VEKWPNGEGRFSAAGGDLENLRGGKKREEKAPALAEKRRTAALCERRDIHKSAGDKWAVEGAKRRGGLRKKRIAQRRGGQNGIVRTP